MPVGCVERGNSLFLDDLLRDVGDLLSDGNDWGSGGKIRLGFVEPALDTVRERDLLLGHSERWEEGEKGDEAHNAGNGRDTC